MATPAWLNDDVAADVAVKVAKNPTAQKAALKAAQDPTVQKAMIDQVKKQNDANSPDWAKKEEPAPVAASHVDPKFGDMGNAKDVEKGGDAPKENPYGQDIPPEDIEKMKKYHLILRVSYIVASAMLGVSCGYTLSLEPELGIVFFCLYGLLFALLMFCFELHWAGIGVIIAANFGFLYSIAGRWVFLLFVGFMQLHLGTIGIVTMSILYAVGLMHLVFACRFPYFPEYQRKLHYEYLS